MNRLTSKPIVLNLFLILLLALTSFSASAKERVTYYHNDHLGSPVAATDAQGELLWQEEYSPYGKRLVKADTGEHPRGYTGHQEVAALGLSYMDARWYDPELGRFLAIDPEDFHESNVQSFNRYAYANNNPYGYVDPNGESPLDIGFLVVDVVKLGVAVYSGVGIGAAAADVGLSIVGVISPVPGTGLALKSAKVAKVAKGLDNAGDGAGVVKTVPISRAKYGDVAEHIAGAQKAGHPDVLTIARDGAAANRKASIGGLPKVHGKQLDEYPPAMFKEGGAGASVRAVSPKNNMGAGACIGNACRGLSNGDKVRIKVVD